MTLKFYPGKTHYLTIKFYPEKSDNEKENEEESDVFNDTIGSLTIAPIAGKYTAEWQSHN